MTLSCKVAEIFNKVDFSVMAATNLHKDKIYGCGNFFNTFILILDHENMGIDTISVTLSCIVAEIFNKIDFSVMAALICI